MKTLLSSAVCAVLLSVPSGVAAEGLRFFSVGSGDIAGNYFPVARAVCDRFNAADDTPTRCSPEPSAGSVNNLNALRRGQVEFAIVQSDWLRAAYFGNQIFADSPPMSDLRVVTPLFPETITLLAGPQTGIVSALDLEGRVVDIGRPASGRNATIRSLLERLEVGRDFFGAIRELDPRASVAQLCEGTIDAALFVVGHPSDPVRSALDTCGARLVDFAGPRIRDLLTEGNDYQNASIDLGLYGLEGPPIRSISVMATLVTRADLAADLVRGMATAVQDNRSELAEALPVLRLLEETLAQAPALGVPLHQAVRAR